MPTALSATYPVHAAFARLSFGFRSIAGFVHETKGIELEDMG